MTSFPVHTLDTAPASAKPLIDMTQQAFGFLPNLIGVMSTSPALTEAYLTIAGIFDKTDLTPVERQVVLLTVSHFHECRYCMAAHTAISAMQKIPADVVEAIRNDKPISDNKLQALRQFVRVMVENRGELGEEDVQNFLDAGYESSHMLDVLVGIAQKMMSNFTNHIAETPLDDAFSDQAWVPSV